MELLKKPKVLLREWKNHSVETIVFGVQKKVELIISKQLEKEFWKKIVEKKRISSCNFFLLSHESRPHLLSDCKKITAEVDP